jgi:hypothetical protein
MVKASPAEEIIIPIIHLTSETSTALISVLRAALPDRIVALMARTIVISWCSNQLLGLGNLQKFSRYSVGERVGADVWA